MIQLHDSRTGNGASWLVLRNGHLSHILSYDEIILGAIVPNML